MIEKKLWGSLPDGREISLYRLTNKWGEYAEFLDYGASLHSLYLLDGEGKLGDVVLGVEGPQGLQGSTTEGATVGRCASRIADGRFVIDGKVFELERGSGGHCLHSGSSNFARQLFQARLEEEENKITFLLRDLGSCGYECAVEAEVSFTFDDEHRLIIEYCMTPEGDTVLSPTNHAYFNLGCQDARDHLLTIHGSSCAAKSERGLPEGEIKSVKDTPLDFTGRRSIGQAMESGSVDLVKGAPGYDESYIIDGTGFREAAQLYCPQSGRYMKVETDMPCLVLFVSKFSEQKPGKAGRIYEGYASVCLETEYVPNAVNCTAFEKPVFHAGQVMRSRTVYAFGCVQED